MALQIIGGLLVVFGIVDLVGSWGGFDLWSSIGIELPELLWRFSPWIEIAGGAFLFNLGSGGEEDAAHTTE